MSKLFIGSFIVLGIALGIGFGVNLQLQLSELGTECEKPWLYRSLHMTFEVLGGISKALDYFNIQNEYESHRSMLDYMYKLFNSIDSDIEVSFC